MFVHGWQLDIPLAVTRLCFHVSNPVMINDPADIDGRLYISFILSERS